MKIILVGMPGSGKSTVGKELAANLNVSFIDLDREIEKEAGKPISDIFTQQGEEYFRAAEAQLLQRILHANESFVLATGGGTPCFHQGMEAINKTGVSIFLDVPIEELIARVENDKNRPLLVAADREELRTKLLNLRINRLACYQQANIITHRSDLQSVMKELTIKR